VVRAGCCATVHAQLSLCLPPHPDLSQASDLQDYGLASEASPRGPPPPRSGFGLDSELGPGKPAALNKPQGGGGLYSTDRDADPPTLAPLRGAAGPGPGAQQQQGQRGGDSYGLNSEPPTRVRGQDAFGASEPPRLARGGDTAPQRDNNPPLLQRCVVALACMRYGPA
jgi:hypothetical protein